MDIQKICTSRVDSVFQAAFSDLDFASSWNEIWFHVVDIVQHYNLGVASLFLTPLNLFISAFQSLCSPEIKKTHTAFLKYLWADMANFYTNFINEMLSAHSKSFSQKDDAALTNL